MILRVLYTRKKGDIGCDIMGQHRLFHDLLKEQFWIVPWWQVQGTFPSGTSAMAVPIPQQVLIGPVQLLISLCMLFDSFSRSFNLCHETCLIQLPFLTEEFLIRYSFFPNPLLLTSVFLIFLFCKVGASPPLDPCVPCLVLLITLDCSTVNAGGHQMFSLADLGRT